ncbi:MAG TPA: ABC transporter substrate-binding protein [Acidimicrobiia bacterium]|nr:ABC transporter substrate-binding protein [Acidimicrobiia bacterium]
MALSLMAGLLVTAGCGTRASYEDRQAARYGVRNAAASSAMGDTSPSPADGGLAAASPTDTGAGGAAVVANAPGNAAATAGSSSAGAAAPGSATRPSSGAAAMPAGGATRAVVPSASPAGRGAASTQPAGAPTPGGGPAAPSVPAPSGGVKAPLVIGSITHMSGPAASGTLPGLDGLQLWVKATNAKGGVNGHPIKLLVADDNTDNARERQLTQEFVEQKGVIAFVQNGEALTGSASVDYLKAKGVPDITSIGGNTYFYESPVHFPLVAHGEEFVKASLYNSADYAKQKGVKRYGLIACTEAQVCNDTDRLNGNADNVKAAGMELVYKSRASLAQPDFTAECIGARNAKVEILQIALDGNSVARVAASCARQNYRPLFSVFGAIAFDKMKDNPDLDGLTVNANGFPYFICGDPATTEFCDAQRKYGPVQVYGIGNSIGWIAGKAFELAAQHVSDNPTSAEILNGLWSFKNETLGGLTHPLTFTKGQNAPRMPCWWQLVLAKGKWTAPNGMKVACH